MAIVRNGSDSMKTKHLEIRHGQEMLELFVHYPEEVKTLHPTVLIFHPWAGRDNFSCKQASKFAENGYVGVALDLYGKGKIGKSVEENQSLMMPLVENRAFLKERLAIIFSFLRHIDHIDFNNMVGIGYCFGGLCLLDAVRNNLGLKGAISVHGLLDAPSYTLPESYKSKILAIHGYKDPLVPYNQVMGWEQEMTDADADFQLMIFGKGLHAFTNPEANDLEMGCIYDPL